MALTLRQQWDRFSRAVVIPSRDEGSVRYRPYSTQRYLIDRIFTALEEGKRHILLLKPRQIGASTVLLIFTLFWMLKHRGLQGAIVTESDGTKEYHRGTLTKLAKGLPAEWSYPIRSNNRYGMQWATGSRLVYEVAGKRKNAGLGKGRGLSYLFADEVSAWGDPEGVDSLRAALSERHPAACYFWGSTAQRFNFFWEMYKEFSNPNAVKLEAIFLPWWRHELYEVLPGSPEHTTYWDGGLNREETAWQDQITQRYGVTLTPTQWAWYRWKLHEVSRSDQRTMHQNFPTLPEHAFQAEATGGFLGEAAAWEHRDRVKQHAEPEYYRYQFGASIDASALLPANAAEAELRVWEHPQEGGHYVVACDPSYGEGTHGDSDWCVIQVWRCEKRRLVQCAEFVSHDMAISRAAWVAMHLAGSYWRRPGQVYFILEIVGPGRAMLQEIQALTYYGYGAAQPGPVQDVLSGIQHYIYRKPDSMSGGGGFWHWLTTPQTKRIAMEKLRDVLLQDQLVIRSSRLLDEIAALVRDGDKIEAPGHEHDDRAVTAALAVQSWTQQVLPMLLMMPDPPAEPGGPTVMEPAPPVGQTIVKNFFERLGAGVE